MACPFCCTAETSLGRLTQKRCCKVCSWWPGLPITLLRLLEADWPACCTLNKQFFNMLAQQFSYLCIFRSNFPVVEEIHIQFFHHGCNKNIFPIYRHNYGHIELRKNNIFCRLKVLLQVALFSTFYNAVHNFIF